MVSSARSLGSASNSFSSAMSSSSVAPRFRVPASGRIEVRVVDGLANPYLALTALLAAGIDGIDRNLEPGEPNRENLFDMEVSAVRERGITQLPATLAEAAAALAADGVLREALGKVPGG